MRAFTPLFAAVLLAASFLTSEADDPHKEIKKWVEKISHYQFMEKCMGGKTMLKFLGAMERFGEECMQLTPAFDIDLFGDNASDEANEIPDDLDQSFAQGIQTLVSLSNKDRGYYSIGPLIAFFADSTRQMNKSIHLIL